jgi:hypothetical protein
LSETAESLEAVDRELVRFEREPNSTGCLPETACDAG